MGAGCGTCINISTQRLTHCLYCLRLLIPGFNFPVFVCWTKSVASPSFSLLHTISVFFPPHLFKGSSFFNFFFFWVGKLAFGVQPFFFWDRSLVSSLQLAASTVSVPGVCSCKILDEPTQDGAFIELEYTC